LVGDAVSAKKVYWGIQDPKGDCIPDVLSSIGEGDAWGSLWNRRYPDSRFYSLKEFAERYLEFGYRAVKLEAVNERKRNNARRKSRA